MSIEDDLYFAQQELYQTLDRLYELETTVARYQKTVKDIDADNVKYLKGYSDVKKERDALLDGIKGALLEVNYMVLDCVGYQLPQVLTVRLKKLEIQLRSLLDKYDNDGGGISRESSIRQGLEALIKKIEERKALEYVDILSELRAIMKGNNNDG